MDILAHSLWAIVLVKFLRDKYQQKAHLGLAALFGMIPDLIAFTFLTIWALFNFGLVHPEAHGADMPGTFGPFLSMLSETLYSFSHSLIIISIIFLVLYIIYNKVYFVLLGWPLHILLDIPTHTSDFYPTPFLWPLSSFTVSGIQWSVHWFMALNYSLLTLVLIFVFRKELKSYIKR